MLWLTSPIAYAFGIFNCRKFSDYKQAKISIGNFERWINQFPDRDRPSIIKLLGKIRYFSEKETRRVLTFDNQKLIERLEAADILPSNIIYVTHNDPGSSSHIMLNLLRDAANLEGRGFNFSDCKAVPDLIEMTNSLGSGAIIYIDDFSATGNQFIESREGLVAQVPLIGQFSEFFLVPSICTEAYQRISKTGVEIISHHVHTIAERPLHASNFDFTKPQIKKIKEYCQEIDPIEPVGYKDMATMVVFYSNTPNTTPVIFRGPIGQEPKKGFIPRSTDLFAPAQIPAIL